MHDLLKLRVFRALAASRAYPLAAQIFTLAAFGLLVAGGLAAPHVPDKMTGILRNTNLAALIVWSLWWPLVIISASLAGRIWCQICPMELVNSFFSRIGLKRRVPRFLASGWGTGFFYGLALLGFIRTFGAHRFPERMAFFFLFLFASAAAAGLIYEKRSFCDHLCPVGRLLGLYACCAPLEWRVRDQAVCASCRSKDCVAARHACRLTARGCTSNLYPASIGDNRDCLVCTQCLKVCPSKNLRLSARRPLADLMGGLRLRSVEFFLLFLVSGLVVWELGEEWPPARQVLEFVPGQVSSWLGATGTAANAVHTLFLFILLPGLLFLVPGLAGRWLNRTTLREAAATFGLLFLPLIALGHFAKAVIRIASRLPYYALALEDPVGYSTAGAIAAGDLKVDMRLAEAFSPWATGLALLALAAAVLSVWRIGSKSPEIRTFGRAGRLFHLVIATVYGTALFLIIAFARL